MSMPDWRERIVIDPAIHQGVPCIKGTRVPVSVLVGSIADGDSMSDILAAYPQITEADIHAALKFAAEAVKHADSIALPLQDVQIRNREEERCSPVSASETSNHLPQTSGFPSVPTLIFGANSSGKSSLIHGLILARHALESGELDVHRTTIGGEAVDLGGFRQYVHRRAASRRVEWATEIDAAQLQGRVQSCLPLQSES